MRRIYKFILLLFIFTFPYVKAIDKCRVTMEVNDNNVQRLLYINTSNNDADFVIPKDGSIPGSMYGYRLRMNDISTNFKHDENNNVIEKKKEYKTSRILYDYDISFLQNNGILYYVIFDGVNESIDSLDFSISFKEGYDIKRLQFYINGKKYNKLNYYLDKNKISGSLNKKLNKGDMLSFSIKDQDVEYSVFTKLAIIFPFIGLFASLTIWLLFGLDRKIKVEKCIYPDNRLSLIDVSRLYKGNINKHDVVLLLFSLISKGYIKIVEEEDDIKLVKLKEYKGHSYSEGILFDAIFTPVLVGSLTDIVNNKNEGKKIDSVSVKDIKISKTIERIIKNENMPNKRYEYFERGTKNKSNIISALALITLVIVTCNPFISMEYSNYLILGVLVSIFSFIVIYTFVRFIKMDMLKNYRFPIFVAVFFIVLVLCFLLGRRSIYQLSYFIGFVAVIIMLILAKYMPKRTIYGSKLYSKMEGYKMFLETCKSEDVKNVLDTNPDYYYDNLEYYYFYNNKDIVSKKFKNSCKCKYFEAYKNNSFNRFNQICDIVLKIVEENN